MLQTCHAHAQLHSRAAGKVFLRDEADFCFTSQMVRQTLVGVYRMLCGGEAAKSKKRTKSSEQHALGQTASVGGLGHYAAPLGER